MTAEPPAGLPAGLAARRPTVDDRRLILALVQACDVAVLGRSDVSLAELSADLVAPGVDNERGGHLVTAADGIAAGWCWTRADPAAGEVFVDVYSLDPQVLRWLLAQAWSYAHELAVRWDRPVTVAAGSYAHDEAYGSVLRGRGLEVARTFWRMRLDLAGRPAPAPASAGVGVRAVRADDPTDLRLLHRLRQDSFTDHWNSPVRDYDDWFERLDASAGRDVTQWWVAEVDGAPAGFLIGSDSRAELGEAHIDTLGVLPGYRGRGVAKTLLQHAFDQAERRGRTRVGLGVDSQNPTGAPALYESVGMRVETVVLAWHATVTP